MNMLKFVNENSIKKTDISKEITFKLEGSGGDSYEIHIFHKNVWIGSVIQPSEYIESSIYITQPQEEDFLDNKGNVKNFTKFFYLVSNDELDEGNLFEWRFYTVEREDVISKLKDFLREFNFTSEEFDKLVKANYSNSIVASIDDDNNKIRYKYCNYIKVDNK